MSIGRIILAKDYSRFPSGRYPEDGPHNGQEFREKVLAPALRQHESVVVVLDGIAGLPSSFLEEAFGGLVRTGMTPSELEQRLEVETSEPRLKRYPALVWRAIHSAVSASDSAV